MLKIKSLSVKIEGKKILDNINLEVSKNSITLLLGKNGAGKSTILSSIMGNPSIEQSGEIFFEGQKISDLKIFERARRGIFLQFQNPPEIEGVRFLKFLFVAYSEIFGEKKFANLTEFKKFCITEISRFGLPVDFLARNLNEGFSGGEKKISEFIQMIILRPKFAMLDEPDSGLDIDARNLILKIITQMKKEFGTTFFIVSHYPEFSLELRPDKVFLLKNGKNFLEGDSKIIEKIRDEGFENV
ncbi:MAG: Fe-S cluster assembly ATPase SufC [Patescibacteria group bacterium]